MKNFYPTYNKIAKTLLFFALLGGVSCDDDAENEPKLSIYLTDSPCADYLKFDIEIVDVQIRTNESTQWESTLVGRGLYNVLELTNGKEVRIARSATNADSVTDVRIIFGTNISVEVNLGGVDYSPTPNSIESPSENVIREFKVNADLRTTNRLLFDFEVDNSIGIESDGFSYKRIYDPSIRYIDPLTTGSIKGVLPPYETGRPVYVITASDTLYGYSNSDGNFLIQGIEPGPGKLLIPPRGSSPSKTIDLVIERLQTSDLGEISFEKQLIPSTAVKTSLSYRWNLLETSMTDDGNFFVLRVSYCPSYTCIFPATGIRFDGGVHYYCGASTTYGIRLYIEKSKMAPDAVIELNNGVPYDGWIPPVDGSYLLYDYFVDDPPRGSYLYSKGSIKINQMTDGNISGSFNASFTTPYSYGPDVITGSFNNIPLEPVIIVVN